MFRPVRIAAAATAVLASILVAAAPASAAPASCAPGWGCTFSEANYIGKGGVGMANGGKLHFLRNIEDYMNYYDLPGWHLNDKISSVYNNGTSGQSTRFYADAHYRGKKTTIGRSRGIPNLNSVGLNDKISSACFERYCK